MQHRGRIRGMFIAFSLLILAAFSALSIVPRRASWSPYAYLNQLNPEWTQGSSSLNLSILAARSATGPIPVRRRVVYPYSVVPGGVQTPEDLRQVSDHDRIVGAHYAGFDYRNARVIELNQAKMVYLSYRIGDKIFWTSKKVSLRKGEKLITDGKLTGRTRCANRVSESAQKGISPEEPPAEKFEQPLMAGDGTAMQVPFPESFDGMSNRAFSGFGPLGPTLLGSVVPPLGGGLPPLYPPPIPTASCPKGEVPTGSSKNPCSHKPPPPTIPEPGTILLVSSGIAGIYWRRRKAATNHLKPLTK